MQKYHIIKKIYDVFIYNEDEKPIIKEISLCFTPPNDICKYKMFHVSCKVVNETHEMRTLFQAIPSIETWTTSGYECVLFQENMENILLFFQTIQQIDPLPKNAFLEIMKLIELDFSSFIKQPVCSPVQVNLITSLDVEAGVLSNNSVFFKNSSVKIESINNELQSSLQKKIGQ